MEIEFDSLKDAGKQTKHGVSLSLAAQLEWMLGWFGWMLGMNMVNCA